MIYTPTPTVPTAPRAQSSGTVCHRKEIKGHAITDHDTVNGLPEARKAAGGPAHTTDQRHRNVGPVHGHGTAHTGPVYRRKPKTTIVFSRANE